MERSGNSLFLFTPISYPQKEWKVTSCNRSFSAESIHKKTTIQNGDSQDSTAIDTSQWLGCLHRCDRCLFACSYSSSFKAVPLFRVWKSNSWLYLWESLWIFTKLMDVIAAHLRQRAISLFPYPDDWLIISDRTTEYNQGTTRLYWIPTSDYQTIFNADSSFSTNFLSLLGKFSAAADLVFLGRLHLQLL